MVLQGKTDAGGGAIFVRVDVDLDFAVMNVTQEVGHGHMCRQVQTLPIGRIMAPHFDGQRLAVPIRKRAAQILARLCAAVLTVERLHPAFERAARLAIERADQRGLPVVPDTGADAPNIANCQHAKQVQPFARLDGLGKIAHCARVCNVALLRHVRHQQVIAHQPFHSRAFGFLQPKAGGHSARDPGPQDRMILVPPLANVMQQERDIQGTAIDPLFQDCRGDRQFLCQVPVFDL